MACACEFRNFWVAQPNLVDSAIQASLADSHRTAFTFIRCVWRAARARLHTGMLLKVPYASQRRDVFLRSFTKARVLFLVVLAVVFFAVHRGVSSSSETLRKYYCFGPAKSPMDMTANENERWFAQGTPVLFNHHSPYEVNATSIVGKDLNKITATKNGLENRERVLMLTPLRDAAYYIPKYIELISQITYPHELIDLAFLVSDSGDETLGVLAAEVDRVQSSPNHGLPFHSVTLVEKDFGLRTKQDVGDRHAYKYQAPRRKAMARARNFLLYSALSAEHSWVYWRDVDIVESPSTVIEDFIIHDKDVVVPNIWFHRYRDGKDIEGRYDYNSWVESRQGRALAASLDKDTIIVEGMLREQGLY